MRKPSSALALIALETKPAQLPWCNNGLEVHDKSDGNEDWTGICALRPLWHSFQVTESGVEKEGGLA